VRRANPDFKDHPVRKVSPDTRARLASRANPARRGLREPKGTRAIRASRARLGQRVRRENVAHKDFRESQPLHNRLLKKVHLRGPSRRLGTPLAGALVAAYLEYAWTQPKDGCAAWHLNLFEQSG